MSDTTNGTARPVREKPTSDSVLRCIIAYSEGNCDWDEVREKVEALAARPDVWTRRPATGWTAETLPDAYRAIRCHCVTHLTPKVQTHQVCGHYDGFDFIFNGCKMPSKYVLFYAYIDDAPDGLYDAVVEYIAYDDLGAAVARGTEE